MAPVLMDCLQKRDFGASSHNAAVRLASDGRRAGCKGFLTYPNKPLIPTGYAFDILGWGKRLETRGRSYPLLASPAPSSWSPELRGCQEPGGGKQTVSQLAS
jgi:hypothetical protein